MSGAIFDQARLGQADFSDADLSMSRMVGAQASTTRFTRANLDMADASHLHAPSADFSYARLHLTSLHGARLDEARWEGCNLSHIRGTDPVLEAAETWQPASNSRR